MDIDVDIPFPEQAAAKNRNGQDDNGNEEAADHEGQAARRTFRGIICHELSLAEVANPDLEMKGSGICSLPRGRSEV
jgi:hypothetical protein